MRAASSTSEENTSIGLGNMNVGTSSNVQAICHIVKNNTTATTGAMILTAFLEVLEPLEAIRVRLILYLTGSLPRSPSQIHSRLGIQLLIFAHLSISAKKVSVGTIIDLRISHDLVRSRLMRDQLALP